jgi:hypothetical protein
MSSVLDTSKPSSLRLLGFVCTAAGGLLIALGSLQTWVTVGLRSDTKGILDSRIVGIDRVEGKATLAIGVLMLVAIVALRIATSIGVRRAIAIAVLVGAIGAVAIAVLDLAKVDERFQDVGIAKIAALAQENGVPADVALEQASRDPTVDVGPGLWLLVGGGVVALVGGLLDLAWVGQQRLQAAGMDEEPTGTRTDV